MSESQVSLKKLVPLLITLLLGLLLLSACGVNQGASLGQDVDQNVTETEEVVSHEQEESEDEVIQDRTDIVFDTESYKDLLTIRYFYLEADEKSGDAIYIESPDGVSMMIDAGIRLTGPKVDEYLEKLGVEKIDYALATHPHHDHIGGYTTLFRSKQIGKTFLSRVPHTTETYKTYINLIKEKEIPFEYLEEGDQFTLGEHVKIEILNPIAGTSPETLPEELSTSTINNNSIVVKLTYGETTFLFTGDLYKEAEIELVERYGDYIKADLLHAPHHGDQTSSSIEFVDTVAPKYTIMSTNIFQSKNVYDRYRKRGSEVFVTGVDGNLLITSDGKEINVITEKDRVGNYLN